MRTFSKNDLGCSFTFYEGLQKQITQKHNHRYVIMISYHDFNNKSRKKIEE